MESPIVVIDNGGCTIKAGMAGEDHPAAVVPTVVGLEEFSDLTDRTTFENFLAAHNKGDLKLRRPIKNGSITSWEDMETMWWHVISKHLEVNPEEASILITEPISNPRPAREKTAEILLEKFNFQGISIATSSILPLYAAGRMTGVVVNVGDGTTQIVPVYEGYPITDAMQRVDLGGHHLTQMFKEELVTRKNLHATSAMPFEVFKLIKEKTCYVVPDYNEAKSKPTSAKSFELPNGEKVEIGEEAYNCPEFLFNPSEFEETATDNEGIHKILYKSIMKTNIDVRKTLYGNIVLSGGSTLFPGFAERLETEMKALVPASVKVNVAKNPVRKYFTWIGGSVLASLNSFPSTLISKQSWEEGSGRTAIANLYS